MMGMRDISEIIPDKGERDPASCIGYQIGALDPYDDEQLNLIAKILLFKEFNIDHEPIHREVFDAMIRESGMRDRSELSQKYQELLDGADAREHAIALDVLRWVMDERVDWHVDEYIEEDDEPEGYSMSSSETL